MGTLTYDGEISIGEACPLVVSSLLPAFANLNGQLTGALALQASLSVTPPTLAATIAATEQVLVNLEAAESAGLPSVSFNLAAVANLIAVLQANLAFLASLEATLDVGGMFAWTYAGTGAAFGGTLTTALASTWPDGSPSSTSGTAVVLASITPSCQAAMASFFGGL